MIELRPRDAPNEPNRTEPNQRQVPMTDVIRARLRAQLEETPDADSTDVAVAVIRELDRDELESAVLPLVRDLVNIMRRNRVRSIEKRVDREIADGVHPLVARRALVRQTFPLPGGRRVEWGAATRADHLERIAMLAVKRDGIQETMDRHADAIKFLNEHGINCIDDADPELAAAAGVAAGVAA